VGLAAAWAGMGVFDLTIFVLTLYRALSRRRAQSQGLVTVLLRDGMNIFLLRWSCADGILQGSIYFGYATHPFEPDVTF
jgi:hypothetical protein